VRTERRRRSLPRCNIAFISRSALSPLALRWSRRGLSIRSITRAFHEKPVPTFRTALQALTAALTAIVRPFGDSGKAEPAARRWIHLPRCDRRRPPTKSCPAAAETATLGFIAGYLALSCVDVREAFNSLAPIGEEVHFRREV
jgi:hypothetical protein